MNVCTDVKQATIKPVYRQKKQTKNYRVEFEFQKLRKQLNQTSLKLDSCSYDRKIPRFHASQKSIDLFT